MGSGTKGARLQAARGLWWNEGRQKMDTRRPSPAAYLSGKGTRPPQLAHISVPERPNALSAPQTPRNSAIGRAHDALVRRRPWRAVVASSALHSPRGNTGSLLSCPPRAGHCGKPGLPVWRRRWSGRKAKCVPRDGVGGAHRGWILRRGEEV